MFNRLDRFLERLAASSTEIDERGRRIAYPWGMFGRGVVVDETLDRRLKRLFKTNFLAIPFVILATSGQPLLTALLIISVPLAVSMATTYALIRNAERTPAPIADGNALRRFVLRLNGTLMAVMFAITGFGFVVSLFMLRTADLATGIMVAGVLGLLMIGQGTALLVRSRAGSQNGDDIQQRNR